jgi:general L-amino acid transport system substrate-binding protein
MKKPMLCGAVVAASLMAGTVQAQSVLETVQDRGVLICGTNESLVGFASQNANGVWNGFDIAMCRAIAAAVLGDALAVEVVPLVPDASAAALSAGEVDVLVRRTWDFSNDAGTGVDFVGIYHYDGLGLMVRSSLGVASTTELDDATICMTPETATDANLTDYFRLNNINYTEVLVGSTAEAQRRYLAGECDVMSGPISSLAASRATFETASDHVILPEILSREPLGPAVRSNEGQWADIVRWTLFALIAAEEYGVTSVNVMELAAAPTSNREVSRLLGTEGNFGARLGLPADWAARVIAAVGNYGEVFEGTIGEATPVGLARGLNAQWIDGGLIYAPPFR